MENQEFVIQTPTFLAGAYISKLEKNCGIIAYVTNQVTSERVHQKRFSFRDFDQVQDHLDRLLGTAYGDVTVIKQYLSDLEEIGQTDEKNWRRLRTLERFYAAKKKQSRIQTKVNLAVQTAQGEALARLGRQASLDAVEAAQSAGSSHTFL